MTQLKHKLTNNNIIKYIFIDIYMYTYRLNTDHSESLDC